MSPESGPSIEPLLRARANAGYADPILRSRTTPRTVEPKAQKDDFLDFLHTLGKIAAAPVTVPFDLIRRAVTSPLTISLVLKLALLGFLVLGSAIFSLLAVGAFWWSWGVGGVIETEGWLTYGSKIHRTPHALVPLTSSQFQEDLRYDIEVEMELVRPNRASEEIGNFMLSLELRSQRDPDTVLVSAAQPSLPPPPLLTSLLPGNPIPCLFPYPFRFLCPSRLLSRSSTSRYSSRRKSKKGGHVASTVRRGDVVLLSKQLMEGVILFPAGGTGPAVGSAFVSIGREDTFPDTTDKCASSPKEVRTTGWVGLRFTPKPTGVRWLLSSHPLPPLLLLPPISITLTLSSSILAFAIISVVTRKPAQKKIKGKSGGAIRGAEQEKGTEEKLLDERRASAKRDRDERREEKERREEWEEVQSRSSGLRRIPEERKRSTVGQSTIGGLKSQSETTISRTSAAPSFAPIPPASESGTSESTATESESATERGQTEGEGQGDRRPSWSDMSEGWEEGQ